MTQVKIAAGTQFETVSPGEMHDAFKAHAEMLDRRFAEQTRESLRGLKLMRLPTLSATATGTTLVLPATASGYGLLGPESGFIWEINRITVATNGGDGPGIVKTFTNPVPGQPAVPASTIPVQNNNNFPVTVVISGGTATVTQVNGVTVGAGDGTFLVPAGSAISVTYSVAPTWVWSNANGAASQIFSATPGGSVSLYTTSDETQQQGKLIDASLQIGVAYRPGSDALYLMPGEGLSVNINSVIGTTYTLTGQVWSCPAEMQGKLH